MMVDFLGTGVMVTDLKHDGTTFCSSEVLKMSVRTCASCLAHSLSTRP